jgi:hypothetical protein
VFGQELINNGHVNLQRRPGQPLFLQQITLEFSRDLLACARSRCLALLHGAGLAHHGQESSQYALVAPADSLLMFIMLHESLRHLGIQILQTDTFLLKPSTELGDHRDLNSDGVSRVALLDQTIRVNVQVPT